MFQVEGNMDIVEANVDELIAQVAQFKERCPEYRADYTVIGIDLQKFKQKYIARHTLRYNFYVRKSFENMHSNVAKVEIDPVPVFFINEQPVLKLSMYNIYCITSKEELTEYLINKGGKDFRIVDFIAKKSGGTAIIVCQTFASACKLQCMACAFELSYVLRNELKISVKFMKIRPLMEMKRRKIVNPPPTTFLDVLINQTPILRGIAKYLNADDLYNFYVATDRSINFEGMEQEFEYKKERYNTPVKRTYILRDAEIFKYTSLIFDCPPKIIFAPFITKLLKNCIASHYCTYDKRIKMDYINLKGITITDQIMGIIRNYIDVRCLVVGEWTLATEMNLACNKLDELGIVNNDHVKLRLLTHKNFSNLTYLTIENCPKLRMRYLCDFVKMNKVLKQLLIEDCTQIDSNCRIGEIIECVWSGYCRLQTFHYIFSEESVFRVLGYHHEPTLEENVYIKNVNFNNNTYIGNHIPEILRKSPNLRTLEILNIRKEFGLDFGYTRHLHTLHMNYNDYFHATLCSLEDNAMRALLVINKKNKCRTKPLNLISIFEILENTDNFIFEMTGNIKYYDTDQLELLNARCQIIKRRQLLSIDYVKGKTEYYHRDLIEL